MKAYKAYKATNNMKCKTLTYEVGKTYTFNGKIKMCSTGFHFCKKAKDVLKYYKHNKDFKLLEIEVLGKTVNNNDKSVTNKLKVLRVIPEKEHLSLLGIECEYDKNNNKIKEVCPDGETWTIDIK